MILNTVVCEGTCPPAAGAAELMQAAVSVGVVVTVLLVVALIALRVAGVPLLYWYREVDETN